MKLRRTKTTYKLNYLVIPYPNTTILVIDSGCDQCIITIRSFLIFNLSGEFYEVKGADAKWEAVPMQLGSGATLATTETGEKYILIINQALINTNPDQNEALLQPHQVRQHDVCIDECSRRHKKEDGSQGTQSITVPADDTKILCSFDGFKLFLTIEKPTKRDLERYPHVELTSDLRYEPQRPHRIRRVQKALVDQDVWRARLGYPAKEVLKKTLLGTTQLVSSLEAESRDLMRDHYSPRLSLLRPHRVNDTLYMDIHFSSIPSIRGYRMWNQFTFRQTSFSKVALIKRKSQVHATFLDVVRDVGAPNALKCDNSPENKCKEMQKSLRELIIQFFFTEDYHQNGNITEKSGGVYKDRIDILFFYTPWAPRVYWCYALEYVCYVDQHLAKRSLDWKTPGEAMLGETQDISVFRFPWFAPIWYYDPKKKCPEGKMHPGFILGIEPFVGDGFSYIILPVGKIEDIPLKHRPRTITRSVVRLRQSEECAIDAPVVRETTEGLVFHDKHGTILGGETTLRAESRENSIPEPLEIGHKTVSTSESTIVELDQLGVIPQTVVASDDLPASQQQVPTISNKKVRIDDMFAESSCTTADEADDANVPMVSQSQADADDYNEDQDESGTVFQFDDVALKELAKQRPAVPPDEASGCSSIKTAYESDLDDDDVEDPITDAVRDHMESAGDDIDRIEAVLGHRFAGGVLELECEYEGGVRDWVHIDLVREECPKIVADYVSTTNLGTKKLNHYWSRWARLFNRALNKACRRLFKVRFEGYEREVYVTCTDDPERTARLVTLKNDKGRPSHIKRKRKKPGANNRKKGVRQFKYGKEVPKTWDDVIRLDEAANCTMWQDAVKKEISALIYHQCFEFKNPGYKPSRDYQYAPMRLVYDVKPDGRCKARLVISGDTVDPKGLATRATVVKTVSVRTLDIIADLYGLEMLQGDIGNAFIQAKTKEKCYTRCGAEFGSKAGCIAILVKALYGLTTSAHQWRNMLADFIRSMGFKPTRFDRDVWMRQRDTNDGYDYICTHVDDFKIVAKDAMHWLKLIKDRFLVKESGEPSYYLGFDYEKVGNRYIISSTTYCTEALRKVEAELGYTLAKQKSPLPTKAEYAHPELDDSPLLGKEEHRLYQSLIGRLQWMNVIGRIDITQAVSCLNRFNSCPRKRHLEMLIHVYGYIKTFPSRKILVDSRPLQYERVVDKDKITKFIPDFLRDYPDAKEEIDGKFPIAFGDKELPITIFVDSDHAHDRKTRRSISGLIAFIGSTPVNWFSKRQGAIASSTYQAEYSALRSATEEAIHLRYMLRAMGIPVKSATTIFGDNKAVIDNAMNPYADNMKKHVAISFHSVREAIAAGIIECYWVKGGYNIADICTKQTPAPVHNEHSDYIFYRKNFSFHDKNRL